MNRVRLSEYETGEAFLVFKCPGCGFDHMPAVRAGAKPDPLMSVWRWNGSLEAPTLEPSLVVRDTDPVIVCHSFIRDGRIQFLNDCTHELAGQTVELPKVYP